MAKSDSFFLRANVTQTGASFQEAEIDLGSFVNFGSKSAQLLRIHNVEWSIADDGTPMSGPYATNATLNIGVQLTTKTQTAIVRLDDLSVVASGKYEIHTNTRDILPQQYREGYLIGVDTLYLGTGADQAPDSGTYNVSLVMECTLESATQANATALAISQGQ
jgi:hypothetical protein